MSSLTVLQDRFVQHIPAMQKAARLRFLAYPPEARQEAIQNTLALAWKFFHSLFCKGRAEEANVLHACFWYAVKQTRVGRRIDSMRRAKDAVDCKHTGRTTFQDFDLNNFMGATRRSSIRFRFGLTCLRFLRHSPSGSAEWPLIWRGEWALARLPIIWRVAWRDLTVPR